jgi:hypothetical protein
MAPMMAEVWFVLKYDKKLFDSITSVMTPESYPNRNDPVAVKAAREMVNALPMSTCGAILNDV